MEKPSIESYFNHIGAELPAHGSGWRKMKCPFHIDTHASAAVNYDKNAFICHGCGVSGDTYKLIQERQGLTFYEAKQYAEDFLTASDTAVRKQDKSSKRLPKSTQSIGRRGNHLSSGGGRRTSARA